MSLLAYANAVYMHTYVYQCVVGCYLHACRRIVRDYFSAGFVDGFEVARILSAYSGADVCRAVSDQVLLRLWAFVRGFTILTCTVHGSFSAEDVRVLGREKCRPFQSGCKHSVVFMSLVFYKCRVERGISWEIIQCFALIIPRLLHV